MASNESSAADTINNLSSWWSDTVDLSTIKLKYLLCRNNAAADVLLTKADRGRNAFSGKTLRLLSVSVRNATFF